MHIVYNWFDYFGKDNFHPKDVPSKQDELKSRLLILRNFCVFFYCFDLFIKILSSFHSINATKQGIKVENTSIKRIKVVKSI